MTVGERIKQRRKELNLTQDELAKKMGYKNKSAICRVEKDYEQNLTLDRVELFAVALETTPSFLMGWNNSEDIESREIPTFSIDAMEVMENYQKLSDPNKIVVKNLIDSLLIAQDK